MCLGAPSTCDNNYLLILISDVIFKRVPVIKFYFFTIVSFFFYPINFFMLLFWKLKVIILGKSQFFFFKQYFHTLFNYNNFYSFVITVAF